jgi:phosphate transport system substrate-binding protein
VEIPLAHGAVAVAANLPGVAGLKLDRELLAGLFLGEIRAWNDPRIARTNPGTKLPDVPVLVVHRADGSGTMRRFSEYVAAASPRFREIAGAGDAPNLGTGVRARGTGGVAMSLKSTLGAIGVLELGLARSSGLTVASLEGADGAYVEPSPEGKGYPLVSTIYAIAPRASGPRATLVTSFFAWALGEGQSSVTFGTNPRDSAFGPLTPRERDDARKALEAWGGA